MNKLLYIMIGISLASCSSSQKAEQEAKAPQLTLIVGTYTGDTSHGIYSYSFDEQDGTAVLLDSVSIANPSYLTPSADGKFVYSVSEMNDSTAAVYAYSFNKENGKFTLLNHQFTEGEDPCYLETNGELLITANYSGGSMSVFPLKKDGTIGPLMTKYKGSIGGPDKNRQQDAHIHFTTFTPDGKFILATDFSADRIVKFQLNGSNAPLCNDSVVLDADTGPRHLVMSPDGKNLYAIGELSGCITALHYQEGKMMPFQTITADSLHARGSADIHISPDGKYLYASNRLQGDGIAIFAIHPQDGRLKQIGYQATGLHPRNFNMTPNGKYLLVACRDSHVIQVYSRDEQSGMLHATGHDIFVSQPVCIRFIE